MPKGKKEEKPIIEEVKAYRVLVLFECTCYTYI